MKTRHGRCYPFCDTTTAASLGFSPPSTSEPRRKRPRRVAPAFDFFEGLPDDIVISILGIFASVSTATSDFVALLLTCRRFNRLMMDPFVLARISPESLAAGAKKWSKDAYRFLKLAADAGNLEACYILGMIAFYCLGARRCGVSLMARAAKGFHAAALYSLAVILFNGSGGTKKDKDPRGGVILCSRAARLGHVDALRELGHCLQDGYGVPRDVAAGRRFLLKANALDLAAVLAAGWRRPGAIAGGFSLLSDFGCNVPASEPHTANRFLAQWFADRPPVGEIGLCSYAACGRPEMRQHEFRRCSVCWAVKYCSRACQALHWKVAHKSECTPLIFAVERPPVDALERALVAAVERRFVAAVEQRLVAVGEPR